MLHSRIASAYIGRVHCLPTYRVNIPCYVTQSGNVGYHLVYEMLVVFPSNCRFGSGYTLQVKVKLTPPPPEPLGNLYRSSSRSISFHSSRNSAALATPTHGPQASQHSLA